MKHESILTTALHDFEGPTGTKLIGDYFVELAEQRNEEITVFEVWGMKSVETAVERHNGFHSSVDECPLVHVMESAECMWSDEIASSLVMDAFTVYPELGGLYVQGGGSTGALEGLNAIGRLLPTTDPLHVVAFLGDANNSVVSNLDDGKIDGCMSHCLWDMCDVCVKLLLKNAVLGESVPRTVYLPMGLVTRETIDASMLFGVPLVYPRMPYDQFDIWPVMDTSEVGIDAPTKAMRMTLVGY